MRRRARAVAIALGIVLAIAGLAFVKLRKKEKPDPRFVPTPPAIMGVMFRLANVTPDDVVYDLGCGDGRLTIMAVKQYGARSVCVEIDPNLAAQAQVHATELGIADKMKVIVGDVRKTDFSDATVVMLALSPELNVELAPRILALKPGSRVVSHWHDMKGTWQPTEVKRVSSGGYERPIYLWIVPPHDNAGSSSGTGSSSVGTGSSAR